MPNDDATNLEELGSFDVNELKLLLGALEAGHIPVEIKGPESGFGPVAQRVYGNPPDGPKLAVLVPSSKIIEARAVAQKLYPV
jgi:hypothetical protein